MSNEKIHINFYVRTLEGTNIERKVKKQEILHKMFFWEGNFKKFLKAIGFKETENILDYIIDNLLFDYSSKDLLCSINFDKSREIKFYNENQRKTMSISYIISKYIDFLKKVMPFVTYETNKGNIFLDKSDKIMNHILISNLKDSLECDFYFSFSPKLSKHEREQIKENVENKCKKLLKIYHYLYLDETIDFAVYYININDTEKDVDILEFYFHSLVDIEL